MINGKLKQLARAGICLTLLTFTILDGRAAEIVLHLTNGDRLAGRLISENTNQIVIATTWIAELAVPVSAVLRREAVTVPLPAPEKTPAVVQVVAVPSPPSTPSKHWNAEASIGADFREGPKNQQLYHGRFTLGYKRPYHTWTIQSFRNVLDYSIDYGWTESPESGDGSSVVSANRMNGSDKMGFDIGKGRWFIYSLMGAGYDKIRKIDFQDEAGPGLGYHLFTKPNFVMNLEGGMVYQEQYRSDQTTTKNFFFRISEDVAWRLSRDITFKEKFEFLPRADSSDFRARAEATLSYTLWRNLALNLSLLDLYDTQPAEDVTVNDLQVHTSVGIKF